VADRNAIRRAVRPYALKRVDVKALRERLLTAKLAVYERTLQDLAQQFGITTPIKVSEQVRVALGVEAGNHARSIAKTFNNDLAAYAFRFGGALQEWELRMTLAAWVDNRNAQRAPIIAVTETYGVYADALMAGFMEAGLEDALFDFGGHPELGDLPPECVICAALETKSPHPLKTVIRIGIPHPNCRQNWHARDVDALLEQLQDRSVQLGAHTAGIVGRPSLITRAGGRRQAAKAILSGRIPR
jgi:hypothetical protein